MTNDNDKKPTDTHLGQREGHSRLGRPCLFAEVEEEGEGDASLGLAADAEDDDASLRLGHQDRASADDR